MTTRDTAEPSRQEVEEAVKAELNEVCPDCYDCGMSVTKVEIQEQVPLRVVLSVRFDPYIGDWQEDTVTLTYDGRLATLLDRDPDFCEAAIEAMGEVLDGWVD